MRDISLLFSTGSRSFTHHLLGDHDTGLDGELSTAYLKQVFQTRTQKVDDEDVVQTLLTEVVDLRDTSCRSRKRISRYVHTFSKLFSRRLTTSTQDLVASVFVSQLRSIRLSRFLNTT